MTAFEIVTGPFAGLTVEEGGAWLVEQGADSLANADDDLKDRFHQWAADHQQPLTEEGWETWINSWESEPTEA